MSNESFYAKMSAYSFITITKFSLRKTKLQMIEFRSNIRSISIILIMIDRPRFYPINITLTLYGFHFEGNGNAYVDVRGYLKQRRSQ